MALEIARAETREMFVCVCAKRADVALEIARAETRAIKLFVFVQDGRMWYSR